VRGFQFSILCAGFQAGPRTRNTTSSPLKVKRKYLDAYEEGEFVELGTFLKEHNAPSSINAEDFVKSVMRSGKPVNP
jgi:hypothetical protein